MCPHSHISAEEVFSTAQLTMSGCGVHMEPAVLDFLRHFPPRTPLNPETPSPPSPPTEPAPLPYTLTPTVSVVDEPSWEPELVEAGENRILKLATSYAIRVRSYRPYPLFCLLERPHPLQWSPVPLNGHTRTSHFVHYREVLLFSPLLNVALWKCAIGV